MAATSCSLYFFVNDGISPFIPLWITRAMCAPLIWSLKARGILAPIRIPANVSEHSFEENNFVL